MSLYNKLLFPKKEILLPNSETKVCIVNPPEILMMQGQVQMNKILDEYSLKGETRDEGVVGNMVTKSTWDEYLRDANMICSHIRKIGTITDDKKIGDPFFDSIKVYMLEVDSVTHDFLFSAVSEFKKESIVPFNDMTVAQAEKLIEDVVKKKLTEKTLNSLSYITLRQLLLTSGDLVSKLLKKNGLSFTSFSKPLLKIKKTNDEN